MDLRLINKEFLNTVRILYQNEVINKYEKNKIISLYQDAIKKENSEELEKYIKDLSKKVVVLKDYVLQLLKLIKEEKKYEV